MTGVRGYRFSRALWISATVAWGVAATAFAALFGPAVVHPAYSGAAPPSPVTPIAGVSGSFNSRVDPYDDVAIVNRDDGRLLIYGSDAVGNLHLVHAYGNFGFHAPRSIVAGDVNGDGRLDLVIGDLDGISVLLGDGMGGFAAASPQRPAGLRHSWLVGTTQIFLADVNHDGRLDIVAAKDDPGDAHEFGEWHLVVLLGRGGGVFGPPIDYDLDAPFGLGGITIFAFGDFDNDGLPGVMYQDGAVIRFVKGHADGTFAAPTVARDLTGSKFVSGRAVAAADIDGDGKLDFIATNGTHQVFWCKGNGNGTLQTPILIADIPGAKVTDKAYHLLVTDLDADGRPDIVVAGKAFVQRSDHTFAFAQDVGTSADTEPLAAAHFNRDPRADLVMQGPDPLTIAVYPSNGHDPPDHVLIVSGAFQSTLINTAFSELLRLRVLDASNVGVKRLPVTFVPPASGASAEVDPAETETDSKGYAVTTAVANAFVGCYDVIALVQGLAGPFPFNLCNIAQDHLVIAAGTPQTALVNTPFGTPLKVQVVNVSNVGIDGVTVTFSVPAGSGAPTATLTPTSAVTSGGGFAQVTAVANAVAGSYDVNVSADGILPPQVSPFSFVLTNAVPSPEPATILLAPPTSPQTTAIETPFANPLRVQVVDAGSLGVAVVKVDYEVQPDSLTGASASLSAASATTDASGFAQITATANGLVGSYGVKVTVDGHASVPPGSIRLGNSPPPAHAMAPVTGTSQTAPITETFSETLRVRLTDMLGNPTPGVPVFFEAPADGPSAELSAASVASDANGYAEVTATANTEAGTYSVGAVVFRTTVGEPIASPFQLTNTGPPTIAKSFGAANVVLNETTSLTFTLTNPNPGASLTGVGFTDLLPAGLVVATPSGLTSTCGGAATAAAGGGSVALANGGLAANGSCTVALNVAGVTVGVKNNTTSAVISAEAGTGGTASATLTVVEAVVPPTIAKGFAPLEIPVNGTATLTFTLTNPNPGTALTDVAFTDTFPTDMEVAATPNVTRAGCGSPTFAPAAGDGAVAFSGGTIAASGTCTVIVDVTVTTGGLRNNVTGVVTSAEGGTGGTASAFLVVVEPPDVAPPTIAKAFGAATVEVDDTTTLTFTLANPNPGGTTLTGVGFTDALPPGLAASNGTSATCGGTLTTSGGDTIVLAGATIAPIGTCTFSVTVTGTTAGVKNNTTSPVTSTEGGSGGTASATLTVTEGAVPPTIVKAFAPPGIPAGAKATLTFTLTNPNPDTPLTGVGFTDPLPAGLTVANGASATCGGALTASGGNTIVLAGATIAPGGICTFSKTVTATAGGVKSNVTSAVTSTNGGTGGTAAAFLVVVAPPAVAPPTIVKAFGAASIELNGTTTLSFTLTNPNPGGTLTGVGFTDALPLGLTVANGTNATCGGTLTATGGNTIALAGATIAAGGTCALSRTVTGTTAGAKHNVTSPVTSTEGGTGGTASATLAVEAGVGPPTIAKAFGRGIILLNETTLLTFTLTNPNPGAALTGVGFTDPLPDGLVVATPNALASTCGGAAIAVAGGGKVTLAGGRLPAGGSCTIALNVTGVTTGAKHNLTGPVTSTEGGTGGTASARLGVLPSPPPIPTLSPWALALLALLVAGAGALLFSRLR